MSTRISRLLGAVPLVLLMAAAGTATAQEDDEGVVYERNSAVPFPVELIVPGTEATHVITGTGIRFVAALCELCLDLTKLRLHLLGGLEQPR